MTSSSPAFARDTTTVTTLRGVLDRHLANQGTRMPTSGLSHDLARSIVATAFWTLDHPDVGDRAIQAHLTRRIQVHLTRVGVRPDDDLISSLLDTTRQLANHFLDG